MSQVWLDSRTPRLNALDMAFIDKLRIREVLSSMIRLDFTRSDDDALVWLPDIVAGAVSAAYGDGDDQYLGPLESVVTVDVL